MEELKIEVPQGMVVDTEKSNLAKGIIKFKLIEKQLPKTWKEFCKTHPITQNECWLGTCGIIYNYSIQKERDSENSKTVGTRQTCEAVLALMQLIQLRDCYNDGWKPDWSDNSQPKYCICNSFDEPSKCVQWSASKILYFKTAELRDQFLNNFRNLIEIAKPLI